MYGGGSEIYLFRGRVYITRVPRKDSYFRGAFVARRNPLTSRVVNSARTENHVCLEGSRWRIRAFCSAG